MAAVSRAVVCQDGDYRMTNKTNNSLTPVAQEAGGLPARTNKTPGAHQAGRSNGLHARRCYVGLGEVPGWRRLRARVVALATAAARLMRAYSAQVETLRRLR
jgi:hypothetical protein